MRIIEDTLICRKGVWEYKEYIDDEELERKLKTAATCQHRESRTKR